MATSENVDELEVAVELQGKPKLIDPSASFRSAVWKSFGFPEVDEKVMCTLSRKFSFEGYLQPQLANFCYFCH
jgi:hypothetical protein